MSRKLSRIAPDWWDYTTLEDDLINDAAKLNEKDLLELSRPGFEVRLYDTLEDFYLAEALEYVESWKAATPANPAGIEFDGQVINEGADFNLNWDASWVVRTQVTDLGWSVEFEIPLRSLRYGESPQVWGLNFVRNIRRKRALVYWAPIERIYE